MTTFGQVFCLIVLLIGHINPTATKVIFERGFCQSLKLIDVLNVPRVYTVSFETDFDSYEIFYDPL